VYSGIVLDFLKCKLSRVKVHKAPGPDGLPTWLLRGFSSRMSSWLALLSKTAGARQSERHARETRHGFQAAGYTYVASDLKW